MGVDPVTASAGAPAPPLVPTPTKAAPEVLSNGVHGSASPGAGESEGANSPVAAEDSVFTSLRDLGDEFFTCVRHSTGLQLCLSAGRWTVTCGSPPP
jgi:hypothetical protein